jgi:hypothetical protein
MRTSSFRNEKQPEMRRSIFEELKSREIRLDFSLLVSLINPLITLKIEQLKTLFFPLVID